MGENTFSSSVFSSSKIDRIFCKDFHDKQSELHQYFYNTYCFAILSFINYCSMLLCRTFSLSIYKCIYLQKVYKNRKIFLNCEAFCYSFFKRNFTIKSIAVQ